MSKSSENIRKFVREHLNSLVKTVNLALRGGDGLRVLKTHVEMASPKGILPAWFAHLSRTGGLGRADGKSVGSAVETLFAAAVRKSLPYELAQTVCVKAARVVTCRGPGSESRRPAKTFAPANPSPPSIRG